MSSRFDRAYRVDSKTKFNAEFWNRIMRDIDTRMVSVEEKKASFESAEKTLLDLGLKRINDTLLPAAERITRVAELGFLVASSDEAATFVEGDNASAKIRAGDQRDLFVPSPFIALTRRSTFADYAIARTIAYDADTGILVFYVETVVGDGGPHNDWDVAALAGSVAAMHASLDETREMRHAVASDKDAVAKLKSDTGSIKEEARAEREAAQAAREGSVTAQTGSERAYSDMRKSIATPGPTPPADPFYGQFWYDGSVTRVYDGVGFVPAVTASIGGMRFDEGVFGPSPDGIITIAGGFKFVMIWLNGSLLYESRGDFTIASPTVTVAGVGEDDEWKYWAYQAIDGTDYDTKEQVNTKIENTLTAKAIRADEMQPLTPEQQGQARANLDAGILAGFRNRIINGDFDIWQRGTDFPLALFNTGNYCADRWVTRFDASGSIRSFSRQNFSTGQSDVPGEPQYFGRYSVEGIGTNSSYRVLEQKIENVRTLSGGRVTLTLYAKSAAEMTLPQIRLRQDFGTGGSPSPFVDVVADTDIPIRVGWSKIQYVMDVPSLLGKVIGTGGNSQLALTIFLPPATAFVFDIAHISLVEGDATAEADPYTPRHIQQELAMCQRYYETVIAGYSGSTTAGLEVSAYAVSTVPKRTTPTAAWLNAEAVFRFPSAAPRLPIISPGGAAAMRMEPSVTSPNTDAYAYHRIALDAEL